MLNLTLVLKLDLIINTCLLFEMYIPRGSRNFDLESCVSTSKEKPNTIRHFPFDNVDSKGMFSNSKEMFSNSVLYLAENWMQDTVLCFLPKRKLEMLVVETLPALFMWAKFHLPTITYFWPITMNKKLSKTFHSWNSPTLSYVHPSCIKILRLPVK